ncbi:MAG: helicase-exonuclease AddAB subunit AddA, partial [Lachnospiraceae bacterium]|nr:helicase-exonuclease AddAB subunit AddA [Lachnospiraceae bacterium]
MELTAKQQAVVDARGGNVVVSAAAGSGKTAVLTRRILSRILKDHVDIDRLLVVTFTRAAAQEMRERILAAISDALQNDPANDHLRKQSVLIHHAQITTIDSFCSFLLKNHFDLTDVDPSFRMADEAEMELLRQDVLEEVLEKAFQEGDPAFLALADTFGKTAFSDALSAQILSLNAFADSNPDPAGWLENAAENEAWQKLLLDYARQELIGITEDLQEAIRLSGEPDGPYPYLSLLEAERDALSPLINHLKTHSQDFSETFSFIRDALSLFRFGRLPVKKDDSINVSKREMAKSLRNRAKDNAKKLSANFFAKSLENLSEKEAILRGQLQVLTNLTRNFREALWEKKKEGNVIDFGDLEHLAYHALVQNGSPTGAALAYREHFEEIFIDEYQDSNLIQESILSAISREEQTNPNRFLVGDVKQSIYRFRQARPELIMEKLATYQESPGPYRRIDLDQNFRSRQEVLSFVNFAFFQLMVPEVGGVAYDERASLKPGFPYPEGTDHAYDAELFLIQNAPAEDEEALVLDEQEKNEDENAGEMDALDAEISFIGKKIKELVGSLPIWDKDKGTLRPASYGDIAILMRSPKGAGEYWQKSLQDLGIPAYVTSRTGYFSALEVQTLLHALRVFHNPLEDVPLFGLLKSPFSGFTDEEIAKIRIAIGEKNKPLYENLCQYALSASLNPDFPAETTLKKKVSGFLEWLSKYRDYSVYSSARELIRKLLYEEGFLDYVSAMPAGDRRKANAEMLLTRAAAFEKTGMTGLHRFVRYMDRLEKYQVDYGEALGMDEHADVVRIMSIHNSKGLEFPVCFLSRLQKSFNRMDERARLIADIDLGLSMDFVDSETRIKERSVKKKVIAEKMARDALGEELRVLYVGMTRAREKLILTGVVKDLKKSLSSLGPLTLREENALSPGDILSASSFLQWILASLARHQSTDALFEQAGLERLRKTPLYEQPVPVQVSLVSREELEAATKRNIFSLQDKRARLSAPRKPETPEETMLLAELAQRTAYQYPHKNLEKLYTKTTVSQLKMSLASQTALAINTDDAPFALDMEMFSPEKEESKPFSEEKLPCNKPLYKTVEKKEPKPFSEEGGYLPKFA